MLQTFERVRYRNLTAACLGFGLLVACSSTEIKPISGEHPKQGSEAIINGTADTTHQAVVFLYGQNAQTGAACSGTIVKSDPASKVAWVLTAAHCVDNIPPSLVIQGNDYSSPSSIEYSVIDYAADPAYDPQNAGSTGDFAVVRIAGADATTPVIPMATAPDGCAVGETVVSVGYGKTTTDPSAPDNTLRHKVTKQLGQVSSSLLTYDISTSGICSGDSGGPVLANVGGTEKVVGVHSYVTGNCDDTGNSDRVTSGATFIAQQLAKAAPADDCNFCQSTSFSGNQPCAQKQRECFADDQCKGYYDCATACNGNATCVAGCAKKYPLGEGPFDAVADCSCTSCANECGVACAGIPKCGYAYPKGTCKTCLESSCCSEISACAVDGQCFACLKNGDSDAACATNQLRQALSTCQASSCNDVCAGVSSSGGGGTDTSDAGDDDAGGDPGATAGGGRRTTTTNGCSVSSVPAGDRDRDGGGAVLGLLAALGAVLSARRGRSARRS